MPIETTGRYGPRHYYDTSNPAEHYPSVTSITSVLPKDLSYWHAQMAAKRALESIDYLPALAANSEQHAVKYLADAAKDYTKVAINKGNATHDMAERMLKGQTIDVALIAEEFGTDAATLSTIHNNFADFLDRTQPELVRAEDIVWDTKHGYAGSFDVSWIFRGNPETGELDPTGDKLTHMSDYKSGKSVYPSVAVQLSAYAMAEYVTSADAGTAGLEPSPTYDALSVLHINEKVCTLKPIRKSVWAPAWRTFLSCIEFQRAAYDWQGFGWGRNRIEGAEDSAFGSSLYTKSGRLQTGTERRR